MKKNLLFVTIALCMVFCLTGCGKAAEVAEEMGIPVTKIVNNVTVIDELEVDPVTITYVELESNKPGIFGNFKSNDKIEKNGVIKFINLPNGNYDVVFTYKDAKGNSHTCYSDKILTVYDFTTQYTIDTGTTRESSLTIKNNSGFEITAINYKKGSGTEQKVDLSKKPLTDGTRKNVTLENGTYTFTFDVKMSNGQTGVYDDYKIIGGDKNLFNNKKVTVGSGNITISVEKDTNPLIPDFNLGK